MRGRERRRASRTAGATIRQEREGGGEVSGKNRVLGGGGEGDFSVRVPFCKFLGRGCWAPPLVQSPATTGDKHRALGLRSCVCLPVDAI